MKTYLTCVKEPSANQYLRFPYKIGEKVILLDRPIDTKYGTPKSRAKYVTVERMRVGEGKTNVKEVGLVEVMSKNYFE